MRILIFGKADILGNIALNRLLEGLHQEHVVEVLLSDYVVDCERDKPYGAFLVAHERDFPLENFFPKVDGLSDTNGAALLTFQGLQKRYDIPISMVQDVNSSENVERVRAIAPDVVLSCRHDYIFKQEIISIPPCGFYNLHPGALPDYRGLSATFWTMLDNLPMATCTFYLIDSGIDTGPVVQRAEVPIDYSRSLFWNMTQVYLGGVEAFLSNRPQLCLGPLPSQTQNERKSKYYSSPRKPDYEIFLGRGHAIISRKDYLEVLAFYLPGGSEHALMEELCEVLPSEESFGVADMGER